MKKTIFGKLAAIMAAVAMTLTFVSCEKEKGSGNDNNNEGGDKDSKVIKTIEASYFVETSEDILKYYDVVVSYGTDKGNEKTEKMTEKKWTATCTYNEEELPVSVFCKAVMKPKADRPAIDPEGVYTVIKKKYCEVSAIYENGKKSLLNCYENDSTLPVKGTKFQEYISKGERDLCDYSYSIQY